MPVPEHAVHYLEIVTPDIDALCGLYARAYGWSFGPPDPALGNARVAELPDGSRCGIRAPLQAAEEPIVRTYLRVDDLEAAARRVAELGATLLLERMELPGYGTIAIYELGGVQQGLWQLP